MRPSAASVPDRVERSFEMFWTYSHSNKYSQVAFLPPQSIWVSMFIARWADDCMAKAGSLANFHRRLLDPVGFQPRHALTVWRLAGHRPLQGQCAGSGNPRGRPCWQDHCSGLKSLGFGAHIGWDNPTETYWNPLRTHWVEQLELVQSTSAAEVKTDPSDVNFGTIYVTVEYIGQVSDQSWEKVGFANGFASLSCCLTAWRCMMAPGRLYRATGQSLRRHPLSPSRQCSR